MTKRDYGRYKRSNINGITCIINFWDRKHKDKLFRMSSAFYLWRRLHQ